MDEAVIKQSKSKLLGLVLGALVMTTGSLFICFSGESASDRIWGAFGAMFFGVGFVFLLSRILRPKPVLVIRKEGFEDYSSLAAAGFVPWEYVEKLELASVQKQTFISATIKIENEDALFSQGYKNILAKANQSFGYPSVNITLNAAKEKPAAVLQIMEEYRAAFYKGE